MTEFLIDAHYFPWHFLFIFLLAPRTCTPSGIIPLPQPQHYLSSFLGPFLSFILPKGMMLVCYRRTHLSTQVPVKILYRPVFLVTVFVLLGASFLMMSHFLEFFTQTRSREYFQQNWSRLFSVSNSTNVSKARGATRNCKRKLNGTVKVNRTILPAS